MIFSFCLQWLPACIVCATKWFSVACYTRRSKTIQLISVRMFVLCEKKKIDNWWGVEIVFNIEFTITVFWADLLNSIEDYQWNLNTTKYISSSWWNAENLFLWPSLGKSVEKYGENRFYVHFSVQALNEQYLVDWCGI